MFDTFLGQPTIQDALSALLEAHHFAQMARDVKSETDPARLRKYANVILRDTPDGEMKTKLLRHFRAINLV